MKQLREDLQPFDKAKLNEMRNLRAKMKYCGRNNWLFWEELETILKDANYSESNEWTRLENDEVVLGEVWTQPIGEFYYKNTVHTYSYLYVATEGIVIDEHGHSELVHYGKDVKKAKEWYIFPDGTMELCKRNRTHKLKNEFKKPIYVLTLKITNRHK